MSKRTASRHRPRGLQAPGGGPAGGDVRTPAQAAVLALQRTAGNTAVAGALVDHRPTAPTGIPPTAIQRDIGDLFDDLSAVATAGVTAVTSSTLWVVDAAREGPALATVRLMIRNGNEDENALTNSAFFLLHPDLPWGTRLRPDEVPEHKILAEQWAHLRNKVVRPELARVRATREVTGPAGGRAHDGPRPTPAPGGGTESRAFLADHRHALSQLPASDDELVLLLDEALAKGSDVRLEYHAYNYEHPLPVPLTHRLFQHRHPDVDPLTSLADAKGKRQAAIISTWDKVAEKTGGWDAIGVTEAHWDEIKTIRDEIVYPFMRIVLPKIEGPGGLPERAGSGERIAHQAHAYLGVRYVLGGSYTGTDPWAADPSAEAGAGLDCSALVRRVLADIGLPWTRGRSAGGSNVPQLRDSPDMVEVTDPAAGDLLFRSKHVGIFIGDGMLIHAPHTGRVVSKEAYTPSKWETIRRYQPRQP